MALIPDNWSWRFGFWEETIKTWSNKVEKTQKLQSKKIKKHENRILKLEMKLKKMRNKSKEQDVRITNLENRLLGKNYTYEYQLVQLMNTKLPVINNKILCGVGTENKVATIFRIGSGNGLELRTAEVDIPTIENPTDDQNMMPFAVPNGIENMFRGARKRLLAESTSQIFVNTRQGGSSFVHSDDAELHDVGSSDFQNLKNCSNIGSIDVQTEWCRNKSKQIRNSTQAISSPKIGSSESDSREVIGDAVSRRKKKRTSSSVIVEDVTTMDDSGGAFIRQKGNDVKDSVSTETHDVNHAKESYSCRICDLEFSSPDLLKCHDEALHGRHECPLCVKPFKSVCSLEKHIRKVHENGNLQEISSSETLHEELYSAVPLNSMCAREDETQSGIPNEVQNTCETCGEAFPKRKLLKRHRKLAHTEKSMPKVVTEQQNTLNDELMPSKSPKDEDHWKNSRRKCFLCKKGIALPNFVSHLQENHQTSTFFSCTICPNAFGNNLLLNIHLKKAHNQVIPTNLKVKRIAYPQLRGVLCSKPKKLIVNYSRGKIRQAIKTIKSSLDRKDDSEKVDDSNSGLSCGIQNSSVTRYKCQYCPKQYQIKHAYDKHMEMHSHRMHAGFYECAFCKQGFNVWSEFEEHVVSSHPEIEGTERRMPPTSRGMSPTKKYRCKMCDKEHIDKEAIRQHVVNVHAWKRAFLCTNCEKSFCTSDLLRRHERKHHQPKKS